MNGLFHDLLLLSYPPRLRGRNGAEMRRLFLERVQEARADGGVPAVVWLWVRTIIDFAVNAIPERKGEFRERRVLRGTPGATTLRGPGGWEGGMESFLKDLRHGLRTLTKNPTFTVIAFVTIGLGIGASTAILSVVRAVLLRPLPYDTPNELVTVWSEMTARNVKNFPISPPVLRDIRESSRLLDDIAGVGAPQQPLNVECEAIQLEVGNVTPNFFSVLGVELLMGRDFTESDAAPADTTSSAAFNPNANPPTVTILSHGFWQTFYGGDPSVLGRTLEINGRSVEIIGVLPATFEPLLLAAANVTPDVALWIVPRFDLAGWNPTNVVFTGNGVQGDSPPRRPHCGGASHRSRAPRSRGIRTPDRLCKRLEPSAGPSRFASA
jgi:MacB-like periplasmic core domain